MKLILLLSLIVMVLTISPQPVPTCSVPHITLKDLPISLNEIQTFNPNQIFHGYNLNYTLLGNPDFVSIREKFKLFKSQNLPQKGLKNFHMDHQDNHWGPKLVTLSIQGNSSIVRWGRSDTLDAIPTVTQKALVQIDPNVHCLDAIWLRPQGLIMVDCYKQANFAIQNVFYYVNVTTQQPLTKTVQNDMWLAFTRMQRRKIFHYVEDGQQYLVRAYFADAVDPIHRQNTYVQILLIKDPFRPWTIKVMDRSYLGQDRLSITDFKIYLGDIYILDYHTGVISFDITPSQNIVIKGRYRTSSGYHKLGIYSNNLANQVLLALANEHGIYEVDWTNQIRPVIIRKYSLMQNSRVGSLWVNEEYIAAQVVANVTNGQNQTQQYHSTFIFDRGTRTYTNAYAVIRHSSYRAGVDLNIQHNTLLSIDEDSIDTYFIDEPLIFVYPTNPSDQGKQYNFTIKATSTNEYTGQSLICSFDMRFVIVDINDNTHLWPTGIDVPEAYYSNYPGQLYIPLNRYINGPNITWGVQQKVYNQSVPLPPHWILQQNDTLIHWDKPPSMFKYTFLRKQQFQYMGDEYFFIYTQDYTNTTHIAQCKSAQFSQDVYCKADSYQPHLNYKINNLTATAFLPNYGEWLHIVGVLYQEFPNEVFLYNVQTHEMFAKPIILGQGWEGKIQSIQFLGHYLVVVLRHMKEVLFFDMKVCHDHQQKICQVMYKIDSITMDQLGVKYFSPLEVVASDFHPYVLFIHNTDSVIILDITRNGPILLDQIDSPGSKQPGFWKWRMAITAGHLVIINPPNIIQEFSLLQLYTRKMTHMTKQYPVYQYTIPDKFDCDFSDKGDMLYITALDKNMPEGQNSVILVYKSTGPAVSAFYDVFHINGKYEDMLIDVTGQFADYVSVTMNSILMMFRQYQVPILVLDSVWDDFEFNITFTNDPQQRYHYLTHSKVYVANYPQGIFINDSRLNQSDYLSSQVKYENKYQQFHLDDSTWFNGSVLNYTLEGCDQCGGKLKVVNHLQDKRDFYAETDMQDYVYTHDGGVIQQFQSLIKMKHNGSISDIAVFPSVLDGQHCTFVKHSWIYDFTVSACEHLGQIYLYTTTFTSFKPFVNGPFYSGAKYVTNLHVMEDLLFIVDVDENPWQMNREGGIIIMAMNHDPFDPQMFDQIQIIQTDDLQHAINWPGGPAFIGNAEVVFTNDSSIYRLAITEVRHGMFFVDFKWSKGRKSIQIMKVEFIDLNRLMIKQNLHMPNSAFFEAITVAVEYYDKIFNYWQLQVVVTTRNFHTLKFDFHIDKTGTVLDSKLSKVFYRYGYYKVQNYIKTFDGYFAIVHSLPPIYEIFPEMSRKVLTVYDTRERWVFDEVTNSSKQIPCDLMPDTTAPAQYMLGGMIFRKGRVAFDFNFTFTRNRTDPFRHIGLLAVHDRDAFIRQIAIHDQIRIIAEDGIDSDQDAKLVAKSDYGKVPLSLKIAAGSGLSGGAIVAIVIGGILVILAGGYFVYRWNNKRKAKIGKQLEESLIDRDTINVPKNEDQQQESQEDDQQDDQQQQDDEEQEEEAQQTPQVKSEPVVQSQQPRSEPAQTAQEVKTQERVQGAENEQQKKQ